MYDFESLSDIVASEINRLLRSEMARRCLQDRSLEASDLAQELHIHAFLIHEKFDASRYDSEERLRRAYRLYIRKSLKRKLWRYLNQSVRIALPLIEEVVRSEESEEENEE